MFFLEVGDCSISYSSNGKSRVMKKKRKATHVHENCRSNTLKVAGGLFYAGGPLQKRQTTKYITMEKPMKSAIASRRYMSSLKLSGLS